LLAISFISQIAIRLTGSAIYKTFEISFISQITNGESLASLSSSMAIGAVLADLLGWLAVLVAVLDFLLGALASAVSPETPLKISFLSAASFAA
jgi:hypothetical protein